MGPVLPAQLQPGVHEMSLEAPRCSVGPFHAPQSRSGPDTLTTSPAFEPTKLRAKELLALCFAPQTPIFHTLHLQQLQRSVFPRRQCPWGASTLQTHPKKALCMSLKSRSGEMSPALCPPWATRGAKLLAQGQHHPTEGANVIFSCVHAKK